MSNAVPTDLIPYQDFLDRAKFGRDGYRAMRRKGLAPTGYKMGRKLYFSEREVDVWLAEVRVKPVPAVKVQPRPAANPDPPERTSEGPPGL